MVETAIYVLLGALTMALAALLALPAVSRRAYRLAQAKARLSAPLSATEARAERDALRAKHAIEIALAERRAAAAEERSAQAQIGLGERANQIARRDAQLADKAAEIARLHDELEARGREIEARDAEISAREVAMHDLAGQRDAAERRREQEAAHGQTLRRGLEARIAALAAEILELGDAAQRAQAAASGREAEARREWAASEANGRRLADEVGDLGEQVALAALREEELRTRLQMLAAARVEAEGVARVARAERELTARELNDLRQQLAASQARLKTQDEADEALRRAIARLGREMVAGPAPAPADREIAS